MEQITKLVQQIGNGGHVYLPKEMVGQKVIVRVVEKSKEDVKGEIIELLKPYLQHIQGVYLCGSYARGEQGAESDIDMLVVTDGNVKIEKRVMEYEIFSISKEQIKKTMDYAAVLILPMLREAEPILNKKLIEEYKKEELTKKNTRWYIETTDSSLKLAKNWISDKDMGSMPNIVYPLIMRLRGLFLIETLIYGKSYSNKELIDYLGKKGGGREKAEQLYRMYREQRDEKDISKNSLDYEDISQLYNIVYEYFQRVKLLWAKLK